MGWKKVFDRPTSFISLGICYFFGLLLECRLNTYFCGLSVNFQSKTKLLNVVNITPYFQKVGKNSVNKSKARSFLN